MLEKLYTTYRNVPGLYRQVDPSGLVYLVKEKPLHISPCPLNWTGPSFDPCPALAVTVFWRVVMWLLNSRNYLIKESVNWWHWFTISPKGITTVPLNCPSVSLDWFIYLILAGTTVWLLISWGFLLSKAGICLWIYTVLTSTCDAGLKYFCHCMNLVWVRHF